MNWAANFFKGILIGIGAIAPGVSGGAFAVMLGIYEKVTDALANLHRDFINKMLFLMPIGLGVGVGVLGFSNVISYLFTHYEVSMKFLFIGLMMGTLPFVVREANKEGFKPGYLLPCVLTFGAAVLLVFLENRVIDIIPEGSPSLIALVVYGMIIGFGTIVPGVSSSIILIYFGAYEIVLNGIAGIDVFLLAPMGVGFALSFLLLAKLINFLFKHIYGYTYYTILGFVFGSIVALFPGVGMGTELAAGLAICFIGAGISYWFVAIGVKGKK